MKTATNCETHQVEMLSVKVDMRIEVERSEKGIRIAVTSPAIPMVLANGVLNVWQPPHLTHPANQPSGGV